MFSFQFKCVNIEFLYLRIVKFGIITVWHYKIINFFRINKEKIII